MGNIRLAALIKPIFGGPGFDCDGAAGGILVLSGPFCSANKLGDVASHQIRVLAQQLAADSQSFWRAVVDLRRQRGGVGQIDDLDGADLAAHCSAPNAIAEHGIDLAAQQRRHLAGLEFAQTRRGCQIIGYLDILFDVAQLDRQVDQLDVGQIEALKP